MGASPIELALAVAQAPVSVDSLSAWGLARPSELIGWLDDARARPDVLDPDASHAPDRLRLTDAARARALAHATVDDFRRLAAEPALVPELLATGRQEAAHRGTGLAARLYRALFETAPPETFPGGPGGFVSALVESVRLYRGASWVLGSAFERALAIATERGDLASQAVLLAASALSVEYGHAAGDSVRMLARAREAAEAVGGEVRIEVLVYTAVHLGFGGRLREAIAAFESLLGDVPMDLLTEEGRLLIDPDALCVLAVVYSEAGQQPRALDLLQRLRDVGTQRASPPIVAVAELFLGFVHAARQEWASARRYVEAGYARFSAATADPSLGWFASVALALVHLADERFDDARSVFEHGLAAWRRAGSPPIVFIAPYDIADALGEAGFGPPADIDFVAEAERVTQMPLVQPAALGHRYLALRELRAASTEDELVLVADRLAQAAALLREAGAVYDLARVCGEAARVAERRGADAEAQRWQDEATRAMPARERSATRDAASLLSVVLDLGRLPVRGPGEGVWGEIGARLCSGFAIERCALVDVTDAPRLLAVRGGSRPWKEEILELLRDVPASPRVLATAEGTGQRILVPFGAAELGARGCAVLDNVYTQPTLGPHDTEILEALGVQLGVLQGNVALWQELARTRSRLEEENRYFRESEGATVSGSQMVVHAPAMRDVMGLVARVAPSNATVLVAGETGVGKELVAREVHRQSPRRDGPFIAVHVASLAPGLVSSGLFGHERGAFTGATQQTKGRFELADGGTLFLDEVGELSPEDQVRLLRVLQEGTFERVGGTRPLRSDFRLVAATHRDLEVEVRAGRFREDLFYRLNAFPIRVPPLRERREEIPTLALYFMEGVARVRGVRFEGIGEADMARLVAWEWPGNVRELGHVIERASLLSEPPRLRIPPLEGGVGRLPPETSAKATRETPLATLAEAEKRHVARVLEHTGGRVTGAGGAAEILGLKPSTLNFRIRKLGLEAALREIRAARRR